MRKHIVGCMQLYRGRTLLSPQKLFQTKVIGSRANFRVHGFDPDNASVLVTGEGKLPVQLTKSLKDMGSWVWCVQPSVDNQKEVEKMMAVFAKGDPKSGQDMTKVLDGIEDLDAALFVGAVDDSLRESVIEKGATKVMDIQAEDTDIDKIIENLMK
eukprot:TRINITY_DN2717_c0_g2_i4.p2 TRINITY_DN2717_c0_g2~~TRINITY_DN2717_c0_g2_i4.p2  ORF type:complete len:182 (-),score=18.56 TRINITY_DN2717_c0_g2_i4:325-792(-)